MRPLRSKLRHRLALRNVPERDAVVAVALPRRLRPVVEHVTLVAATADAVVFEPRPNQLEVPLRAEPALDRPVEAGPACAAVVFGLRAEEREVARGADVAALPLLLVERARERRLRRLLEEDLVRLARQELVPFRFGFVEAGDLLVGRRPSAQRVRRGRQRRHYPARDHQRLPEPVASVHGETPLLSYFADPTVRATTVRSGAPGQPSVSAGGVSGRRASCNRDTRSRETPGSPTRARCGWSGRRDGSPWLPARSGRDTRPRGAGGRDPHLPSTGSSAHRT